MKFKCEIGGFNLLKNGSKLTLTIDKDQTSRVIQHLNNFNDMPLICSLEIDAPERLIQLSQITPDQRKKIYALFRDIASHTGDTADNTKENLKAAFCSNREIEGFSLSNCSAELAGDFIEWLIYFCFENGVPLAENPREYLDDIERSLAVFIEHRLCIICGQPADIHHVDTIGMGRDRRKVDDSDYQKWPLCRKHHTEAHTIGVETFAAKYHLPLNEGAKWT